MVLLTIFILGLIFTSVGVIQKLVEINWTWSPIYYGLLIIIIILFIEVGFNIYDYFLYGEEEKYMDYNMINEIINTIKNKGYFAETRSVVKNGINKTGISISKNEKDLIRSVFYIDDLPEYDTPEEYAEMMINTMSEAPIDGTRLEDFSFDLEDYKDKIFIGVQASNIDSGGILTRPSVYDGIDMYVYCLIQDNYSTKVTQELLDYCELDKDELFSIALANTFADTTIESLTKMLFGMELEDEDFMYIVSNTNKVRGAASMLNRSKITQFAISKGWKAVAILPSSIHEIIIIPYDEDKDNLDTYKEMVAQINCGEVIPEEKLVDDVFIINL